MSEDRQADVAPPPSDGPGRTPLSFALWQFTQANRDFGVVLARRIGLHPSDMSALEILMTAGPLGPSELGERLGMRSASATALVDRLEAAGHVTRARDHADRRRVTVHPTEHAYREAGAAIEPMLVDLDRAAEGLSDAEREAVLGFLRRVTATMREHAEADA